MRAATEPPPPLTSEPLAHLDETGRPHLLEEHLIHVGDRARAFAERFGAGEWAPLAGRWHDPGKYSRSFQHLIRPENGFVLTRRLVDGDVSTLADGHGEAKEAPHQMME